MTFSFHKKAKNKSCFCTASSSLNKKTTETKYCLHLILKNLKYLHFQEKNQIQGSIFTYPMKDFFQKNISKECLTSEAFKRPNFIKTKTKSSFENFHCFRSNSPNKYFHHVQLNTNGSSEPFIQFVPSFMAKSKNIQILKKNFQTSFYYSPCFFESKKQIKNSKNKWFDWVVAFSQRREGFKLRLKENKANSSTQPEVGLKQKEELTKIFNIHNLKDFQSQNIPLMKYSKLHEFKLVTISIASPEKIKEWAEKVLPNGKIFGEVTNANTLHYKTFKPHKGGLFCERIFGPLKDFECACGIYAKPTELESKKILEHEPIKRNFCPNCDVEYTWSVIRRYELGYIQLVSPVSHIWYLKANPSYLSLLLDFKRSFLESIIYCTESITLENLFKNSEVKILDTSPKNLYSIWQKLVEEEKNFQTKNFVFSSQSFLLSKKKLFKKFLKLQTRLKIIQIYSKNQTNLNQTFVFSGQKLLLKQKKFKLMKKEINQNFDLLKNFVSLSYTKQANGQLQTRQFFYLNNNPFFEKSTKKHSLISKLFYKKFLLKYNFHYSYYSINNIWFVVNTKHLEKTGLQNFNLSPEARRAQLKLEGENKIEILQTNQAKHRNNFSESKISASNIIKLVPLDNWNIVKSQIKKFFLSNIGNFSFYIKRLNQQKYLKNQLFLIHSVKLFYLRKNYSEILQIKEKFFFRIFEKQMCKNNQKKTELNSEFTQQNVLLKKLNLLHKKDGLLRNLHIFEKTRLNFSFLVFFIPLLFSDILTLPYNSKQKLLTILYENFFEKTAGLTFTKGLDFPLAPAVDSLCSPSFFSQSGKKDQQGDFEVAKLSELCEQTCLQTKKLNLLNKKWKIQFFENYFKEFIYASFMNQYFSHLVSKDDAFLQNNFYSYFLNFKVKNIFLTEKHFSYIIGFKLANKIKKINSLVSSMNLCFFNYAGRKFNLYKNFFNPNFCNFAHLVFLGEETYIEEDQKGSCPQDLNVQPNQYTDLVFLSSDFLQKNSSLQYRDIANIIAWQKKKNFMNFLGNCFINVLKKPNLNLNLDNFSYFLKIQPKNSKIFLINSPGSYFSGNHRYVHNFGHVASRSEAKPEAKKKKEFFLQKQKQIKFKKFLHLLKQKKLFKPFLSGTYTEQKKGCLKNKAYKSPGFSQTKTKLFASKKQARRPFRIVSDETFRAQVFNRKLEVQSTEKSSKRKISFPASYKLKFLPKSYFLKKFVSSTSGLQNKPQVFNRNSKLNNKVANAKPLIKNQNEIFVPNFASPVQNPHGPSNFTPGFAKQNSSLYNKNFVLKNSLYTISYFYGWSNNRNWKYFFYYNSESPKIEDKSIYYYKNRNLENLGGLTHFSIPLMEQVEPYETSLVEPIGSTMVLKASDQKDVIHRTNPVRTKGALKFNGLGEKTKQLETFTGASLIQKLLTEFDSYELKKIMKQHQILIPILNRSIRKLNKSLKKKTDFIKIQKFLQKRDHIIRRLKFISRISSENTNPNSMILSILPVLPPDLRPILKLQNQIAASDLNRLYQRIIYRNERLKKFLRDPSTSQSFEMKYAQRLLQEAVDNLIENGKGGVKPETNSRGQPLKSLSEILKGKQGRFRQYLLGKRVDYSGRSVIVVGPKLKLSECGLPVRIAMELFLPFLIKKILHYKLAKTVVGAKNFISSNQKVTWNLLNEIMKNHPILLNRAPTLHRLGIQAFMPKLIHGQAILLHPLVCSAFNADFDGDQMAVHVPITVEARTEAWSFLFSRNHLLSAATGEPIILPSQDMVLGCYYLTSENLSFNLKQIYSKNQFEFFLKKFQFMTGLDDDFRKENLNLERLSLLQKTKLNIKPSVVQRKTKVWDKNFSSFLIASQLKGAESSLAKPVKTSDFSIKFHFIQNIKRMCFYDWDSVLTAYETNQIELQSIIWLKWNGKVDFSNESFLPVEIKINSFGHSEKICSKCYLNIDSKGNVLSKYIRTTPGKVLINTIIKNCIRF
jgi:DNA-directed RNA polymerase beta' subunit